LKIKISLPATEDLDAIEAYIRKDNPDAAVRTVLKVLGTIEQLAEFPNIGRPGRIASTRELVVGGTPLIAIYGVREDTIFVYRVLHGARRWPPGN